jgi:hypothetical protein
MPAQDSERGRPAAAGIGGEPDVAAQASRMLARRSRARAVRRVEDHLLGPSSRSGP